SEAGAAYQRGASGACESKGSESPSNAEHSGYAQSWWHCFEQLRRRSFLRGIGLSRNLCRCQSVVALTLSNRVGRRSSLEKHAVSLSEQLSLAGKRSSNKSKEIFLCSTKRYEICRMATESVSLCERMKS